MIRLAESTKPRPRDRQRISNTFPRCPLPVPGANLVDGVFQERSTFTGEAFGEFVGVEVAVFASPMGDALSGDGQVVPSCCRATPLSLDQGIDDATALVGMPELVVSAQVMTARARNARRAGLVQSAHRGTSSETGEQMKSTLGRSVAVAIAAILGIPGPGASAHDDHGPAAADGVAQDDQHGHAEGHLDPVQNNVRVVGKAEVINQTPGQSNDGRVADVFHYKNYAYLTAFREPTCENTGVHVIDIHDLANPFEVVDAFIPTSPGNFTGEGMQVIHISNKKFKGDVLIHNNENCPGVTPAPGQTGGISLWNVTNPLDAQPLALHAGDYDGGPRANQAHSMFAWNNVIDKKTYVVIVDDEEVADLDIMDISDPANPVMVNDTLDLDALFGVNQASPSNLTSSFSHDMMVQRIGTRYVMNASYWDGGYVLLDVTNPASVTLMAETDYAALDEERLARGHEISPEGNAHQSEISNNGKYLIGTDEDFGPYRNVATITGGPFAGTQFTGTNANGTPPIAPGTSILGTPTWVGLACGPLPPGTGVALAERGTCTFQAKLDNITAAGYTSGIVMNSVRPDCETRVTMAASGTIPFVFVQRSVGLQMLGVSPAPDPCVIATPGVPVPNAVSIQSVFDGWGYVRLFKTDIPKSGGAASITQIDTYAVPESQDEDFAVGFGALSVHEVAIDPTENLAYFSYYAAGFRVARYSDAGLVEVGAFIDEGGNDFWGVDILERDGNIYVLASDRDYGLYILEYTGA